VQTEHPSKEDSTTPHNLFQMASTEPRCQEATADPQVNCDSNTTLCFETGESIPLHDNLTGLWGCESLLPTVVFTHLILFQIPDNIPIEIVFVILSFLGPKELLKVSLLNSFYRGLSRDDALWKAICSSWGIGQGTKLILVGFKNLLLH